MSTLKSSAENLTLNADGSGNDIKFQSDGSEVGSLTAEGVLTATSFAGSGAALTGLSSFDPDGAVVFNESGADVDFRIEDTGGTHAFFLQGSEGRIGINHSTPDARLEIHPESETGLYVESSVGGETTAIFKGASTSAVDVLRVDNSAEKVFTVEQNGEVTVSIGDIVFGTAGKGICLGSTTNVYANTLDDYEEGTWSPTFDGNTMTNYGTYRKIGKMVYVVVTISEQASSATFSTITGLPFSGGGFLRHGRTMGSDIDMNDHTYMASTTSINIARNSDGAGISMTLQAAGARIDIFGVYNAA